MAQLTYIGAPGDDTQVITVFGQPFTKGEPTEVSDERIAKKLANNPTFAEEGEDAEIEDSPEELEAVRAELTSRGIAFSERAKLPALRKKLQDATEE